MAQVPNFSMKDQFPLAQVIQGYQQKAALEAEQQRQRDQDDFSKAKMLVDAGAGMVSSFIDAADKKQKSNAQEAVAAILRSGSAITGYSGETPVQYKDTPEYKSELASLVAKGYPAEFGQQGAKTALEQLYPEQVAPKERNVIGDVVGNQLGLPGDTTVDAAKLILDFNKSKTGDNTEKEDKKARLKELEKNRARIILDKTNQALTKVSGTTTGLVGQIASKIGGTKARDLKGTIETIQANLGFEQLQKMREASPTGGALGQIAVKELDLLQAAVASLDQAQDNAQVKSNLEEIEKRYSNWLKVTEPEEYKDYVKSKMQIKKDEKAGIKTTSSGNKYQVRP